MAILITIKSIVFKKAWSLVKATGKTLSEALKWAWAKCKHDNLSKIVANHFEHVILPFKKECYLNDTLYDGVIRKLDDRNTYHQGLTSWSPNVYPELVNFTGYLISVSGEWFNLFDSQEFKKEIDSICYRIDGKKVTCNCDGVYRWAITPTSFENIVAIATKYKLQISLS